MGFVLLATILGFVEAAVVLLLGSGWLVALGVWTFGGTASAAALLMLARLRAPSRAISIESLLPRGLA
ncbi:hypothetical protein [Rubellimicrobium roseum]|uniref:Uncharacterized protein n=1 Tax=Rubellimicrobium roseum TaxID=687525 RepID=A0A5C4N699_9RHOB|nr:hypothetical protein [Rubellimicrobium roseum]TNC65991.1 hypothetical protein FHG71_17145 [Rubellimicrobium roseum]